VYRLARSWQINISLNDTHKRRIKLNPFLSIKSSLHIAICLVDRVKLCLYEGKSKKKSTVIENIQKRN
jgi:hypothetical protein